MEAIYHDGDMILRDVHDSDRRWVVEQPAINRSRIASPDQGWYPFAPSWDASGKANSNHPDVVALNTTPGRPMYEHGEGDALRMAILRVRISRGKSRRKKMQARDPRTGRPTPCPSLPPISEFNS